MTDDATFDRVMIAELLAVLGDAGADRVVAAFLVSLATRRSDLDAAVERHDLEAVRRAGHAIKGMAASAGAVALAKAGERVQHAEPGDVPELVALLEVQADIAAAGIADAWS